MKIDLWIEGYAATGEHNTAQFLGSYETDSYVAAVVQWHTENWTYCRYGEFRLSHSGHYSIWGCRIFDNEADARKAFG